MNPPLKFRFVNEITGAFVLLTAALLVAGIYFAARSQGLFERKFRLYTVFTSDEGSYGLNAGALVKIRNTDAGKVVSLTPNPDGGIQATYEIKESFHLYVRQSSKAKVKKAYVLAGDAYVEIGGGDRNEPLLPHGAMIETIKDTEIIEQAKKMMDTLQDATLPALQKAQMFLDELPGVTVQLRKTLNEAENVMRDDVPGVSTQLSQTLLAFENVLRDDVPGLARQAQDTLHEIEILAQGLQRHWLLRKYIEPRQATDLIAPSDIGPRRGGRPP